MDTTDKIVTVLVIFALAVTVLVITSIVSISNSPCSELGNLSVKDLPSRCLKEISK